MNTDILVVGIGGQGVMTAAETIARAALAAGLEATKTEVAGMSQRGGVVCSQVRIGTHIEATRNTARAGDAAARLRVGGGPALEPLPRAATARRSSIRGAPCRRWCPPGTSTIRRSPRQTCVLPAASVVELDARSVAAALGDVRLANSVMLGAAAGSLPFAPEFLRAEVLRRFGKSAALADANGRAFDGGRALSA